MNALDILCAQLMRDLFAKAKFLLLQNMKNNQTTCKTIFFTFPHDYFIECYSKYAKNVSYM